MATAEKRQQHHWQQQRLRSAGKSRSQVRSGATTAVRSMTATAISMEFNQQQPPAENSHTQSPPPPATHIYASVHPTTHPPTKLSVSQAFIQSVSQSVTQSVSWGARSRAQQYCKIPRAKIARVMPMETGTVKEFYITKKRKRVCARDTTVERSAIMTRDMIWTIGLRDIQFTAREFYVLRGLKIAFNYEILKEPHLCYEKMGKMSLENDYRMKRRTME